MTLRTPRCPVTALIALTEDVNSLKTNTYIHKHPVCVRASSVKPFDTLAVLPAALLLQVLVVLVVTDSVLLAVGPLAVVLATVEPLEETLAVALVLLEVSDVLLAVWPDQVALPVHFVVEPVSVVALAVGPVVQTLALNLIHMELALVN